MEVALTALSELQNSRSTFPQLFIFILILPCLFIEHLSFFYYYYCMITDKVSSLFFCMTVQSERASEQSTNTKAAKGYVQTPFTSPEENVHECTDPLKFFSLFFSVTPASLTSSIYTPHFSLHKLELLLSAFDVFQLSLGQPYQCRCLYFTFPHCETILVTL